MIAAKKYARRPPLRRGVFALGASILAAAIAVIVLVAFAQLGGPDTRTTPPVPFVDGVGAPVEVASASLLAGSAAIGTTAYDLPSSALYVSPAGDNDSNGSEDAPLRTLAAAVSRAEAGATIVLRAGQYREKVTIPEGKPLTLQGYPNESVWLDGSREVDGWSPDGAHWSVPWEVVFDSSPTYERGAEDNTQEHWNFVTSKHPLAAHPDQLWSDDTPLTQVGQRSELTATSFFHDEDAGVMYLGFDPSDRVILASELQRALSIRAEGTVIRGIGIRRYAPSVPDFGAVTIERPHVTLENVIISESATTGLFITAANTTLRNVTSTDNGMIGVAANFADNLTIEGLKASGNNTEWFNRAPVAGGMKLTRSRTVVISGSEFSDNNATGLWFDQSSRDIAITGSRLSENAGHGLFLEISARAVVADNYLANNRIFGMKINDTSSVEIRNNVVVGSTRNAIAVLQDDRLKSDPDVPGHDERYLNDPDMTWLGTDVSIVGNTVVGDSEYALILVEDYSRTRSARDFGITIENNLYARAENGTPKSLVSWPMNAISVTPFASLDDFTRRTGSELTGIEFLGTVAVERAASEATVQPEVPEWIATTFGGFPAVAAALGSR